MNEMIERVARALCVARGINPDHIGELPSEHGEAVSDHAFPQWRLHIKLARASIAAMREPLRKMANAAFHEVGHVDDQEDLENCWKAMIDEALK